MNKMTGERRAKVFWSGRSQAVRLPKDFRFDTDEVTIRRQGDSIVLKPVRVEADEWAWLDRIIARSKDIDLSAAEEDEGPFEDRPERDEFFK